ncbi:MAG: hypothetical protein J0L93_03580 [Deltaproteobacteria bacterium]|nr:hypothetical protein [Deltaproteobacteria bacterium]
MRTKLKFNSKTHFLGFFLSLALGFLFFSKLEATESLAGFMEALQKAGVPAEKIYGVVQGTGVRSTDLVELKVKWMKNQGIPDATIGDLISKHPQILSYRLEAHGEWFRANGFQNIAEMFKKYPEAFGLKVKGNLDRKLTILKRPWGLSIQDIENHPLVLGASYSRLEEVTNWLTEKNFPIFALSTTEKVAILIRGKIENAFDPIKILRGYPGLQHAFFIEAHANGLLAPLVLSPDRMSADARLRCQQIVSRIVTEADIFRPVSQQRITYQRILTGK